MVTKAQKFRLGIFILITSVLLIVFLILIAGKKILEKRDTYYIKYEDRSVTGLQIGGPVKYHGIRIGRVDEIKIDSENVANVIVTLSIKDQTPIKKDVKATLVPIGITGLLQIEIVGGTNEAELIKPLEYIEPGESKFENITGKAEVIAEKLEILLNNFTKLTNESNRKKFNSIITNVDEMVYENKNSVNNIVSNFDDASKEITTLTKSATESVENLNKILEGEEIQGILSNLDKSSSEISKVDLHLLLQDTHNAIKDLNDTVDEIGATHLRSRQDIVDTIESLNETIDYLNEFSRQISEDPSLLLRSRRK